MINPLGGVARRATYIKSVREKAQNVALVDAGNVFGAPGLLGQLKAEKALEAMGMMSYDMLNLGSRDLNYGVSFLAGNNVRCDSTGSFTVPTVSANIVHEDSGELLTVPHKLLSLGRLTVGFVGIVAKEYEDEIIASNVLNERPIMLIDEKIALQAEIEAIRETVDVLVVLAQAGIEGCTALAQGTEGIDVMICGGGEERMEEPLLINGVHLVKVAPQGVEIGSLVLTLDGNNAIRGVRGNIISLTDDFPPDAFLLEPVDAYHACLEDYKDELLGSEQKDPDAGGYFTGYAVCESCHAAQTDHWLGTDHAGAFDELVAKNQDYNPECIPCHTTGFGYTGGFIMPGLTSEMEGVQCEMCHGAGGEHLEDQSLPYGVVSQDKCLTCHTEERSPQFDYGSAYLAIRH